MSGHGARAGSNADELTQLALDHCMFPLPTWRR